MVYGSKPTDGGNFLMNDIEKEQFLKDEPEASKFVRPFISAHEYLRNEKRWVLWLFEANPNELRKLPKVMARINAVEQFRKASKASSTRDYEFPSLFRQITQPVSDYILIPRHTSEKRNYIPFGFFSKNVIVGDSCLSMPDATLFHFAVLTNSMHMAWVRTVCGRLKSDFRYSKDIVYNNFPWPEVNALQTAKIEAAAQVVLDARAVHTNASLADLYDPLTMPANLLKAHQALDKAVDAAYGYKGAATDAARVAFLFERYQQITSLLPALVSKTKKVTKKPSN